MKKLIPAVALLALVAGCQAPANKPAQLSIQAQTAMLQAEQDIKLGKEKKADTAKAEALYQQAKDAAGKGDSDAVTKLSEDATKEALKAIKAAQ